MLKVQKGSLMCCWHLFMLKEELIQWVAVLSLVTGFVICMQLAAEVTVLYSSGASTHPNTKDCHVQYIICIHVQYSRLDSIRRRERKCLI